MTSLIVLITLIVTAQPATVQASTCAGSSDFVSNFAISKTKQRIIYQKPEGESDSFIAIHDFNGKTIGGISWSVGSEMEVSKDSAEMKKLAPEIKKEFRPKEKGEK